MKRLSAPLVLATVLALWATIPTARPVLADDTPCVGTPPTPVVVGNLIVPSGAVCVLDGHTITGNILVQPNGHLNAKAITVGGDVQAEGHNGLFIDFGSVIVGDVQAKKGIVGSTAISSSKVRGDIELTENDQSFVGASGNKVLGNIKIEKNTAGDFDLIGNRVKGNVQFFTNNGPSEISGNTIKGNLQCKENVPPPASSGNVVRGNNECPDADE